MTGAGFDGFASMAGRTSEANRITMKSACSRRKRIRLVPGFPTSPYGMYIPTRLDMPELGEGTEQKGESFNET